MRPHNPSTGQAPALLGYGAATMDADGSSRPQIGAHQPLRQSALQGRTYVMIFKGTVLRGLSAALLAICFNAAAQVPLPRAFAVLSEVAREVSVVSFQESTGSRLGNNLRQRIAVPDGALDKVFLLGAQKTLKQGAAAGDIWLLAPADTDFFGFVQVSQGSDLKIPDDLLAALRERRSTHLLLFTRHRAEADLRFANRSDGTGTLEGMGYYVDHQTLVTNLDTGETVRGYLAAFTHFRATLIDVATQKVVASSATRANLITPVAGSNSSSTHPWATLTAAQKMSQLRVLVEAEVGRMVTELIAVKP